MVTTLLYFKCSYTQIFFFTTVICLSLFDFFCHLNVSFFEIGMVLLQALTYFFELFLHFIQKNSFETSKFLLPLILFIKEDWFFKFIYTLIIFNKLKNKIKIINKIENSNNIISPHLLPNMPYPIQIRWILKTP